MSHKYLFGLIGAAFKGLAHARLCSAMQSDDSNVRAVKTQWRVTLNMARSHAERRSSVHITFPHTRTHTDSG